LYSNIYSYLIFFGGGVAIKPPKTSVSNHLKEPIDI